jgi:hypothetical protein
MRHGARDQGEECLVNALALEPDHMPALVALACLSLHQGALGEHGALERAVAAGEGESAWLGVWGLGISQPAAKAPMAPWAAGMAFQDCFVCQGCMHLSLAR